MDKSEQRHEEARKFFLRQSDNIALSYINPINHRTDIQVKSMYNSWKKYD